MEAFTVLYIPSSFLYNPAIRTKEAGKRPIPPDIDAPRVRGLSREFVATTGLPLMLVDAEGREVVEPGRLQPVPHAVRLGAT